MVAPLHAENLPVLDVFLPDIRLVLVHAGGKRRVVCDQVGYPAGVVAMPVCKEDMRNLQRAVL